MRSFIEGTISVINTYPIQSQIYLFLCTFTMIVASNVVTEYISIPILQFPIIWISIYSGIINIILVSSLIINVYRFIYLCGRIREYIFYFKSILICIISILISLYIMYIKPYARIYVLLFITIPFSIMVYLCFSMICINMILDRYKDDEQV